MSTIHFRNIPILALLIAGAAGCSSAPEPQPLRMLTYNIHGGGPIAPRPAAAAALASAHQGRSLAVFVAEQFAQFEPDVIALQEARSEAFVAEIAGVLKMHVAFFPGGWRDASSGRPDGIPAAILSRHPIVETVNCPLALAKERPKDLFTRGYGKIVIDAYGEQIAVFVAHLLPSWKNTTHIREREIAEISAASRLELDQGRSVLVLGDMNHRPEVVEYRLWAVGGFVDAVATTGWGEQFTSPSQKPSERIDYVFVAGPIAGRLESATTLTGAHWVVEPANEASFALSDHLPVIAVFKAREN